MTTPPGADCPGTPGPSAPSGRVELARLWERALRATAYVPISRVAIERSLRELLDQLFDGLVAEKFSPEPGRMVGQRLVASYFTDASRWRDWTMARSSEFKRCCTGTIRTPDRCHTKGA
ncbi:MAG: hypothetical protein ACRDST_03500 [Pseudonocardiaceae bacterium]